MSRIDAHHMVNTVFDAMAGCLADGDRVEVRGFGTLIPGQYPGHIGRNPKTGEAIKVPPKRKPLSIRVRSWRTGLTGNRCLRRNSLT